MNASVAATSVATLPSTSTAVTQEELETQRILLEPFVYLTQQRGKEIRTKLIKAFDAWLKVPEDKLKLISEIIEMLHTASLLIDDVEDGSDLRRGIPVAHKIFGVASAINSGNYVYVVSPSTLSKPFKPHTDLPLRYFLALKKANSLKMPVIMEIFADELIHLHTGQGMEIYWRDNCICPTEREYVAMVRNKTGGLLRLAVRMMQACSGVHETRDFVPLVDMLGIHFQIRDDYLNLISDEFTNNKGFAEDLTEGKFSFPVVQHIQTTHASLTPTYTTQTQLTLPSVRDPGSRQIFQILKQRTHDVDLKRYAIKEMRESLVKVKGELVRLEVEAREEVARLGGNEALEAILEYLGKAYR
ncbi:terpenoid synthase [Rhizoclosmatium globosum]|uniref:Terpenoid synthase n=1 Tax=Rhizoclosmatium globosum TaxID=329046 RepID=A0A1Y2B8F4_9FUNG|nr:terpenoid synthase [Rhizoclosmatium globosum]|eukprot:ORY31128.1 terpenoid synthase [Rhizoclosmatium globosum]